jgi:hypothetical protein
VRGTFWPYPAPKSTREMLNTLNAGSIISEQFVTIQDDSASLIVCFCNPAETECGMTVSLSAGIPRERFKARLWRFEHTGIGSLKKRLRTFSLSVCSKNLMHVRAPAPNKEELHSNTSPNPHFLCFTGRSPLPAKTRAGYRPESTVLAPPPGLLAAREHSALNASSMPLP